MGENTAIEWTDATVNFWWGCTKIGPGCEHCYAETWAKRTGDAIWGVGVPRKKIKSAVKTLYAMQNKASWWAADCHIGKIHPNPRRRVFMQSMSDLFDVEVPLEWFAEAWQHICACDSLDIQIVTKRIRHVARRLAAIGADGWPKHAGLMISVVNQEEADRDIPVLIALKSMALIPWIGLSMEPLLGKVTLRPEWLAALDWVIVGGESGTGARPMHPDWVRSPRDQCAAAGVPFHFKQWGEWVEVGHGDKADDCEVRTQRGRDMWTAKAQGPIGFVRIDGKFFAHFDDIQGKARLMHRVGKKAAGRLLDGQQHDGMQT